MRNRSLFVAIAVLLIGQSVLPCLAADEKSPDGKPLAEWEAKLTEQSAAGKEYAQRFHGKTAEELAAMAASGSTQLALLAKWESLGCRNEAVAPPEPSRFLGYLEGKTGLTPPIGWQYDVTCAAIKGPGFWEREPTLEKRLHALGLLEYAGKTRLISVGPGWDKSEAGVSVHTGVKMHRQDDWLIISQGTRTSRIPYQVLSLRSLHARYCSTLLTDDYSILAFHHSTGGSSKLLCYDARTAKPLWESATWGSPTPRWAMGPWQHCVEMVRSGNTLGVFGSGSCGHYLEAFDIATGKNQFRFSVDLWLDPFSGN